jgi:hypothetical protein
MAHRRCELESKRQKMEAEINVFHTERQTVTVEMNDLPQEEDRRKQLINTSQDEIGRKRKADR